MSDRLGGNEWPTEKITGRRHCRARSENLVNHDFRSIASRHSTIVSSAVPPDMAARWPSDGRHPWIRSFAPAQMDDTNSISDEYDIVIALNTPETVSLNIILTAIIMIRG
ncbi:hypothetical protein [Burkholderia cenocepacia]|uniref:hypothetical protein n=1 Tax=Burkholderia cenocepacia TaxID=95486 RepID=UPI002AAFF5CD|nr:hypothetical protein [Burkholderia cenocepacia]